MEDNNNDRRSGADNKKYDLLSTVKYGGCSAKIGAGVLKKLLSGIELPSDDRVMVDISSADDAGVYRLNDDTALIVTTDFFPPICSDGYEFGEIAAANSLSDVYAMGGRPLLALNLNMFPSATVPVDVLGDILRGGQSKINESGALTMGGHTIDDETIKYGLAVVGTVHPDRVITNAGAAVGDVLILTKALGSGVLVAGERLGMACDGDYRAALQGMKRLNDLGAQIMQRYDVRGATDVTGFGLAGHLLSMMRASGTSAVVSCSALPILSGAMELLLGGCIPGAAFRNLDFVRDDTIFDVGVSVEHRMLACDAQTSGGLLICCPAAKADAMIADLLECGKYPAAAVIGHVTQRSTDLLHFV